MSRGIGVLGAAFALLVLSVGISACGGDAQSTAGSTATSSDEVETSASTTTEEVDLPKQLDFAPPACPIDSSQASQLMEEPMAVDPAMTSGGSCQFTAESNSDYLLISWYEPESASANRQSLNSERQASIASGLHPTTPSGLGAGAVESHGLSEEGEYQSIIYWELDERVIYVIVQSSAEREQEVNESASYLAHALTS